MKLQLAAGVMAAVAVAVGGVGLVHLRDVQRSGDRIYQEALQPIKALDQVKLRFYMRRLDLLSHMVAPTPQASVQSEQAADLDHQALLADLAAYERADAGHHQSQLAQLRATIADYDRVVTDEYYPASRRRDSVAVQAIRANKLTPLTEQIMAMVDAMARDEDAHATVARAQTAASYRTARTTIIATLALGLVAAFILFLWISRHIVRTLRRVEHVAQGLDAGDLTRTADIDSDDEVGRTAKALDRAMATLSNTMTHLNANAHQLNTASNQLLGIANGLASSASESADQASTVVNATHSVAGSIHTLAASSEEMTSAIGEIASNASRTALTATTAMDIVTCSEGAVRELGTSSQEISDIVGLITNIAAQTNLLALNAGIEAARAGEAGKGFAVVAGEVKDLANATAQATNRITTQINTLQRDSATVIETIGAISTVVSNVSEYAETIASAVEEQAATTGDMTYHVTSAATATDQITSHIESVATAAQSAASAATDARQAAAELESMAITTTRIVAGFRLRTPITTATYDSSA